MPKRQYEILLPFRYSDGRDYDPVTLYNAKQQFMTMVGGMTADSVVRTVCRGNDPSDRYEYEAIRLTVDLDDSPAAAQAVRDYKSVLSEQFDESDIYVTSRVFDVV